MRFEVLVIALSLLLVAGMAFSQEEALKADPKDWIQLFNGKDLDRWTVKIAKHKLSETFDDTFRIENVAFAMVVGDLLWWLSAWRWAAWIRRRRTSSRTL
jgi:hypothetical protein